MKTAKRIRIDYHSIFEASSATCRTAGASLHVVRGRARKVTTQATQANDLPPPPALPAFATKWPARMRRRRYAGDGSAGRARQTQSGRRDPSNRSLTFLSSCVGARPVGANSLYAEVERQIERLPASCSSRRRKLTGVLVLVVTLFSPRVKSKLVRAGRDLRTRPLRLREFADRPR